jgi:serine/threonine protein kinase/peptidoglycan hydrolase-like protein with peptidoglycan-binding domain
MKETTSGEISDVDISALPPGATIGRYEVVAVLGQGGFGITYRARDLQLGREVAIKEYLPTSLAYRDGASTVMPRSTKVAEDFSWGRERFVAEGRTMATLHDAPGIVKVFDFIETNGTAYIVMEMLRGETLEAHVTRQGPMGPAAVERLLWPLLVGLEQVHDAGFLHRDIKPANILLGPGGSPTLIDFGASRAAMAGRTTALTAVFTPGYAAPEQFSSARQGPPTDIYALSATLYYAITGSAPPSAFDRMLDDTYEPIARRALPGFPPGLLAGIDAGLAVRAPERPQSIAGWRSILAMTGGPSDDATVVVARRPPAPAPVPGSSPRSAASAAKPLHRVVLLAGVAAIALALAGGGYFLLSPRPAPPTAAVQEMKIEDLERVLAERRKAEAEAAEKKQLAEEARQKATADSSRTQAETAALERTQAERQKAEQELARLKVELEAQKAAAAEAETARQAEAARAREQAERQKAETEAALKAEAEARQKADAEAADRRTAEANETALRLGAPDRQHVQVALTSLGFDTRGSDGAFGPRTRDMIAAWQKARNQPTTGFLSGTQNQALLREAAAAIGKYDTDQKKIEEDRKKAEEEAKLKAEAEAKAKGAAPPPVSAPAAAPAPATAAAPPAGAFDGNYEGTIIISNMARPIVVRVTNGSGFGGTLSESCGATSLSFNISPAGDVGGTYSGYWGSACEKRNYSVKGKAKGRQITLDFDGMLPGSRGYATLTLK